MVNFLCIVKQAEIERDNQKLLKKLVEISAGKKAPATIATSGLGKSHSVANIEFKAKSLHFNQRKAELERIERENQKIAKKIFTLKSDLNKNTFQKDFNRHEAIKNNLARMKKKRMPFYAGRQGALPPIESDERQGSAPTAHEPAGMYSVSKSDSDYATAVQMAPPRNQSDVALS